MAKGDFYFPLFYKRLLTSTIGWKDDEFGAYLRLLIHQFDNGSIPSDIEELALLAPSIKKNRVRVLKKFKDQGDGTMINEVMDEVYQKVQKKKQTNRENGSGGGRPIAVKTGEIRFYLIECYNNTERFYKAGTTNDTIKRRFSSVSGNNKAMPYTFTVLLDVILPFDNGISLERDLAKKFEMYSPQIKFGGHLECYQPSKEIIDYILKFETDNPVGYVSVTQPITEVEPIPITNNKYQITKENTEPPSLYAIEHCLTIAMADPRWVKANKATKEDLAEFNQMLERRGVYDKNPFDYKTHYANWKAGGRKEESPIKKKEIDTDDTKRKLEQVYGS